VSGECQKLARSLLHKDAGGSSGLQFKLEIAHMKWETPAFNDIRFGFEVTMYINNK